MKNGAKFVKRLTAVALFLFLISPLARVSGATVQVLVANGGLNFSPSSVSIQAGDTVGTGDVLVVIG